MHKVMIQSQTQSAVLETLARNGVSAREWLSEVECTEYARHRDQNQYLAKRWLVKELVGQYVADPQLTALNHRCVQVNHTPLGAPYLTWVGKPEACPKVFVSGWPLISLSDDSDRVAVMLCRDRVRVEGADSKLGGVGIDIVSHHRLQQAHFRHPHHFAKRVLSECEYAEFSAQHQSIEYLATCWAVKEAVAKALGTGFQGGIAMQDIILHDLTAGDVHIEYQGKSAERIQHQGVNRSVVQFKTFGQMTQATALLICAP